jgi:hypothetical protein
LNLKGTKTAAAHNCIPILNHSFALLFRKTKAPAATTSALRSVR